MTGIERLHDIAYDGPYSGGMVHISVTRLREICEQIVREVDDISGYESDVLAFVEENGGLDEVKKRLMPEGMEWPRFEDGEPVRLGDAFSYGDETFYVDSVQLLRREFHLWATNGKVVTGSNGERCERPAPKVLDADGEEIHKGDTVWCTNGHGPFEVTSIVYADKWRVVCDSEENGHLNVFPESITHRAPVIAGDGKPLREGETVWDINDAKGYPGTVSSTELDGFGHVKITCEEPVPASVYIHPSRLTHERPVADSWERLEEDADGIARLFEGVDEYASADIRDLVRRAKALAERDA